MRRRASMVACGAVLLAAACNSSGGNVQPAIAVEKSTAIAQANAICKQLNLDAKQLITTFTSSHPNPSDADARDFWVNTFLPRYDRAIGDIHRIGEPTKDRVQWDTAVDAVDAGLSDFKTEINDDPVKAFQDTTVFDRANQLFAAYGATECAKKA